MQNKPRNDTRTRLVLSKETRIPEDGCQEQRALSTTFRPDGSRKEALLRIQHTRSATARWPF